MDPPGKPRSRDDFEIAIICALQHEAEAVEGIFDAFWEDDALLPKATKDPNAYTLGKIGVHNVVLAHMPGMGKRNAASLAAFLSSSFTYIRLGLVVGICGGVPFTKEGEKISLGDVIISTSVVQTDFGRQYQDEFVMKDTLEDRLGQPNQEIRGFLGNSKPCETKKFSSTNFLHALRLYWPEMGSLNGNDPNRMIRSTCRQQRFILGPWLHRILS